MPSKAGDENYCDNNSFSTLMQLFNATIAPNNQEGEAQPLISQLDPWRISHY